MQVDSPAAELPGKPLSCQRLHQTVCRTWILIWGAPLLPYLQSTGRKAPVASQTSCKHLASWKRQYFPQMVIHPEAAIFLRRLGPGPEGLESQLCPFLLPQSLGVCWAGLPSPRTGVRLQIPEKLAPSSQRHTADARWPHSRPPLRAVKGQAGPPGGFSGGEGCGFSAAPFLGLRSAVVNERGAGGGQQKLQAPQTALRAQASFS